MRFKNILLLFLLSIVSVTVYSQDVKKVAILETVDAAGDVPLGVEISVRSKITYAITEMPDYEAYDRINLSDIFGEHDFQRSGNVSDEQIKRMGEMYGVDYILVSEVAYMDVEKRNLILASRIIDVETTKIAQTASVETTTDAGSISNACRTLASQLLVRGSSGKSMRHSSPSAPKNQPARDTASPASSKKQTAQVSSSNNIARPVSSGNGAGGYTENTLNLNLNMVFVEGGTFTMGATAEQTGAKTDGYPAHTVYLDGYYISECEITQAQWQIVMGTTISSMDTEEKGLKGVGATYPMYYVSWEDAVAFCNELSRVTGKTYMLPTEAQWEYAARGGNMSALSKFSGGNDIDAVAWYDGNSNGSVHPVAQLNPNELGLYDMSGNLLEWCSDCYGAYSAAEQTNPTGPAMGEYRLLRGGRWSDSQGYCLVSFRSYFKPSIRSSSFGFRVVCLP